MITERYFGLLGPSHIVQRTIAITWRLRRAMPGETFRSAGIVA